MNYQSDQGIREAALIPNGYEQAKDDILISNKAMTASAMEKAEEETAKLREKLIK